jgi:hypothetical protein
MELLARMMILNGSRQLHCFRVAFKTSPGVGAFI